MILYPTSWILGLLGSRSLFLGKVWNIVFLDCLVRMILINEKGTLNTLYPLVSVEYAVFPFIHYLSFLVQMKDIVPQNIIMPVLQNETNDNVYCRMKQTTMYYLLHMSVIQIPTYLPDHA